MQNSQNSFLLTHIASKYTNRTEDVAVDALGYLLAESKAARDALRNMIEVCVNDVGELIDVETFVSGDDGKIPDLTVYDHQGLKRVLIEAKFWASLGEQQAESYLEMLPNDSVPSVLLIIAPEIRFESLWAELVRLFRNETVLSDNCALKDIRCLQMNTDNKYLILSSWRRLLDKIYHAANQASDSIVSDIQQLQVYCEQQDSAAFLPISANEFSPAFARRILNLNGLIDDIVVRATSDGIMDLNNLKATPQPHGYGRYIRIGCKTNQNWTGAWFGVNFENWSKYRNTPLWLTIYGPLRVDPNLIPIKKLQQALNIDMQTGPPDSIPIPIYLPIGVEKDKVIDAIIKDLNNIASQVCEVD